MKKSVIGVWIALAVVLILTVSLLCVSLFRRQTIPQTVELAPYSYLVKAYDGKIGVFEENSDTPIQIVDMVLSLLPPYDQAELEKGILIRDEEALRRLLEDFTS